MHHKIIYMLTRAYYVITQSNTLGNNKGTNVNNHLVYLSPDLTYHIVSLQKNLFFTYGDTFSPRTYPPSTYKRTSGSLHYFT